MAAEERELIFFQNGGSLLENTHIKKQPGVVFFVFIQQQYFFGSPQHVHMALGERDSLNRVND